MKRLKQLNLYPFYDLSGMEHHLQAMASKGWHIRKTGTFFWDYEKGEKETLQYALCWSGEAEAYEPKENSPGSFRENAKKMGWSPAVMSDRLQVYASDAENPGRLSVSPFDRLMGIHQAAGPNLFFYGTMVMLGILSILLMVFRLKVMPVATLASGFSLVVPLVLTMLAAYYLADMILYIRYKNRAEIAAAGKSYAEGETPMAKILFWILVISGSLLGLAAVISGGSPLFRAFFLFLAVILGLLFIAKTLRSEAAGKSRTAAVVSDVVLAVILVVGIGLSVGVMNRADAGHNGTLPVTAQDLGLTDETEKAEDYLRSKASLLLRYTEASQVMETADGNYTPILSYEMVERGVIPANGLVLNHYLNRMSSSARKDENGEVLPVRYKSIPEEPWGADKAWQMTDGTIDFNVYLLLYEDRLVELGVPVPLTEDQMQVFGQKIQK